MTSTRCFVRAAAVLVCAAAIVGCARGAPKEAQMERPAAAVAEASPAPTSDPRTRGWSAGGWYAYTLHMTSSVTMGSAKNAFDFDVDASVRIATARFAEDQVT